MTQPSYLELVASELGRGKPAAAPPNAQAIQEDQLAQGKLGTAPVPLIFPDDESSGGYSLVAPEHVSQALKEGAREAPPDYVAKVQQAIKDHKLYGGAAGAATAGLAGALRGVVPFGLTDEAVMMAHGGINALRGGTYEEGKQQAREVLQKSAEAHPYISGAAELGGMAATMGTSAEAQAVAAPMRGISALGRGAEKLAEKGVGAIGGGKIAQKAAGFLAQGATEGAILGVSNAVDESILGDTDLAAQNVMASAGHGAMFGGALGLGIGTASGVAGKVGEKVSGILGGRAAARAAEDAALAAERAKAIQAEIDKGATPEEAEAIYRANNLEPYTTNSTRGDRGARYLFEGLGANAKQSTRAEARLGKTFKVQIGEALDRENITGSTVEELGESADQASDRIQGELNDAYKDLANTPIRINAKAEYLDAVNKARELEQRPLDKETGASKAQWRAAEIIAKRFGLDEEVKAASLAKDPSAPKLPKEPNYDRLARAEVGPEPKSQQLIDAEKAFPKSAEPKFDFLQAEKVARERLGPGASKEEVNNLVREAYHGHFERVVAPWRAARDAAIDEATRLGVEGLDKWKADYEAAVDLFKEQHNREVTDAIANWVAESERVANENAARIADVEARRAALEARKTSVGYGDWHQLRREVDDDLRQLKTFTPEQMNAVKSVRWALRNQLETASMNALADFAKATGKTELYEKVTALKQRMVEVSVIKDILSESKGRYAGHKLFSLTDKIVGSSAAVAGSAIGQALLGPIGGFIGYQAAGALGAAGSKFARNEGLAALGRYLYRSSGAPEGAAARLLEARNVVHATGKRIEIAAKKAVESKGGGGLVRTEDKTLYRKAEKLVETLKDPAALQAHVQKQIGLLTQEAPQFATAFATRTAAAIQFLQSQMPQDREPSNPLQPHLVPPRPPNDLEVARYARMVHAVDKPLEMLDLLAKNRLTKEHVVALKEVYPGIYQEMRDRVFQAVQSAKKPLDQNKLLQLGTLFGTAFVPAARPENVSVWQQAQRAVESPAGTSGVNPQLMAPSGKSGRGPGRPSTNQTAQSTLSNPHNSTLPAGAGGRMVNQWGPALSAREARRY